MKGAALNNFFFRFGISLLLLVVTLLTSTCKKENICDCVKGTGKEITEERQLSGFNKIFASDKVDVHLTQGSDYSVKVVAGKQVIKLIKTKVENGVLTISDDNRCDFTRSYKRKVTVYVTMPGLRSVINDGVGDVYMDNRFTCDTLNYSMSNSGNLHLDINANTVYGGMHGNGDVYMKGSVAHNFVHAGGQGYYHGFEAVSGDVILTLKTSGSAEVNVNAYLKIEMYARSTGNIYFKGYPATVEKVIAGSGKLVDSN